ncbi:MAG: hypothetical protein ACD_43C00270G0006 [uncultured bacterium]|nr:MAG: hypothetical protein ACD_43C00270G0006 [uncultured bacterium]
MKKRKSVRQVVSKIAVGTTLAAVLAAGAAAYFFTKTPAGKSAAKKIKTTVASLSKEIAHKVSAAKDMTQKKYNEIVEQVIDEAVAQKKVGRHTVKALKRDLKSHWKAVHAELKTKRK